MQEESKGPCLSFLEGTSQSLGDPELMSFAGESSFSPAWEKLSDS